MKRTLLLPALLMAAAAILVAVSYSALAGSGPVSDVADAVIGSDTVEDSDTVNETVGDVDTQDSGDEEAEVAGVNGDDGDGEALGAMENAEAIAAGFGVDPGEVMALHDEGIGFGALVKLYQLAKATSMTVEELLASMETDGDGDGDDGYAFGKRFKELSEEQVAMLDGIPRNLGQLKKALRTTTDGALDGDGDASSSRLDAGGAKAMSNGNGPPAHAKAHGRR